MGGHEPAARGLSIMSIGAMMEIRGGMFPSMENICSWAAGERMNGVIGTCQASVPGMTDCARSRRRVSIQGVE